jgi:hypothetical protein
MCLEAFAGWRRAVVPLKRKRRKDQPVGSKHGLKGMDEYIRVFCDGSAEMRLMGSTVKATWTPSTVFRQTAEQV